MMLYHGSYVEVAHPDLSFSRDYVDFGRGFYTTALIDQAKRWCVRFKREGRSSVVSRYELLEAPLGEFRVKRFDSYSEEWLDFVLACRRGCDESKFDVVEGGVANDKVFNTVELYFDGLIDKYEAIRRLSFEKPNHQMCFRTQQAADACLRFLGSDVL